MDSSSTTVAILHPGDLGAALGRLLTASGTRVVAALEGRGAATRQRCAEAGIEDLGSLEAVAGAADVVVSLVPQAAAAEVAERFRQVAEAAGRPMLFIDANSISPEAVTRMAADFRGPVRFVDGAVRGAAGRLATHGTLYLSGPDAEQAARVFEGALPVRVLGDAPGTASELRMLMAGLAKGLVGLVGELGAAAADAGLLEDMLQGYREHYPGVMEVVDRMMPTYAAHAHRRVDEMAEVEGTIAAHGLPHGVTSGVRETHEALDRLGSRGLERWDAESVFAALAQAGRDRARGGALEDVENQAPGESPGPPEPGAAGAKGHEMSQKQTPRSAELNPGPGFRIRTDFARLDAAFMKEFQQFPTPDVSDLLNRLYAVDPSIHCLTDPSHRLAGPACTVKVFPGDNLMVHKSLDVARPGDIVVVAANGSTQNAVLGDLISTKAKHRGIAGFIIDGLVRDLPDIAELDFPVFARGTTPIGPLHRGPGEINYPIACGGVVINPGDLIIADAAGVVVVPRGIAADLLERLKGHKAANEAYYEAVARGEFSNAWVDVQLEALGCEVDADDVTAGSEANVVR